MYVVVNRSDFFFFFQNSKNIKNKTGGEPSPAYKLFEQKQLSVLKIGLDDSSDMIKKNSTLARVQTPLLLRRAAAAAAALEEEELASSDYVLHRT